MANGVTRYPGDFVLKAESQHVGLRPTSLLAECPPRVGALIQSQSALVSGRQSFSAIVLKKGMSISKIVVASGGTAAASPTHQWFSLYDSSLNKLAVTADDTTTAWAAQTTKELTVASGPYVVPADGVYYVGVMVTATTVPTICGVNSAAGVSAQAPRLGVADTTNTGLSTPSTAPATAGTLTDLNGHLWTAVK